MSDVPEMVDRVARVIAGSSADSSWQWGSLPIEVQARDHFYERARTVIAAMREPTVEMVCPGGDRIAYFDFHRRDDAAGLWRAMIDKALRTASA